MMEWQRKNPKFFRLVSLMLLLSMVYSDDSVSVPFSEDAQLLSNDITAEELHDRIDDSFFDPVVSDPSCSMDDISSSNSSDCWGPPQTTVETEEIFIDATRLYGGDDPSETPEGVEKEQAPKKVLRDKHWGTETHILKMRDKLRKAGKEYSNSTHPHENRRPPIFLMPGLASTRLVSWRYKSCSNPLLSDVKVQDYVWMNLNMLLQMATIDGSCFLECMTLGLNQTDYDDEERGCKLRPDEGLDAISSLAPDSIGSKTLVGGKNTVYAWLTQWLADNLGYDVSSIVGLPYDWRLSPDIMEKRDGFLTVTRRRIEAAVAHNGEPGIMVAHSMGNNVFRYFLEWLRNEMHEEAFIRLLRMAEVREKAMKQTQCKESSSGAGPGWVAGLETERKPSEAVTYSDTIYKMANSVVSSLDGIWQSVTGVSDDIPLNTTEEEMEHPILESKLRRDQLWELAQAEGDDEWLEWIDKHIWTYVGLSAPLLGAINPLRAVISGENMGMPMTEKAAREMEITFGSTHTLNPISTSSGFCDMLDGDKHDSARSKLACLEELMIGIDETSAEENPWENFPTLKAILKDRVDWDTDVVPFKVVREICRKGEKSPCKKNQEYHFTPKDVQSGDLFTHFGNIWNEEGEPLKIKREQLAASWWMNPTMPNLLNMTWDRPHIKHVIMSYGVDYPTEVGYVFKKVEYESDDEKKYEDVPMLTRVVFEEAENNHYEEIVVPEMKSLADSMLKKKPKKEFLNHGTMHRSGDASVPYLSLAWAHTWLLHATRAMRHSKYSDVKEGDRISDDNALNSIKVSYRPAGGSEWMDGGKSHYTKHNLGSSSMDKKQSDISVGDEHPHGTKYKPEMFRYQSKGKSRSTGMEYTTAVIEAVGVEHKETTRNYDILAAVFSEVLINMHEDFGLV
jgi:hypothetical protein